MALVKEVNRGRAKFCSRACANTGEHNPNYKNGISANHYHYKKIQLARYPERVKARKKVAHALLVGRIKKKPCQNCGDPKVFAHHHDYSKPLEVEWLCRQCHRAEHNGKH